MTENKKWTVTIAVDEETGDVIFPLPDDMLDALGLKEGDTIAWIDNKDGSWSIEKHSGE